MGKLEVFFDYLCPHCLRGHEYLTELLPRYPEVEVEWRPCEAHPRPEEHGRHSDLCACGMYFALDHGGDPMEYHRRMYRAGLGEQADVENPDVIAETMSGFPDADKLREALSGSRYDGLLQENNRLAWDELDFPAVPSYRMNGKLLKSRLGIGVSKEELHEFIRQNI